MTDLAQRSVQVILDSQAPGGGYPAATGYPTYAYCWFRDGAYVAHAMDLVGEHRSAAGFHDWVARTLAAREEQIRGAIARREAGQPLRGEDVLHTRYTLDGDEASVDWPNFQLDGLGTWLWSLARHADDREEPLPPAWSDAATSAADYLAALWDQPCYDLWEELPEHVHTHTLAAIHGGLRAHQELAGADHEQALDAIDVHLRRKAVVNGHFTKHIGSQTIDASLVGLATPYRFVAPDDPLLLATVEHMEGVLWQPGTGVHRYPTDTYYGGGEWVVLAGWVGWYLAELGDTDRAASFLRWIEAQADEAGHLPEQVAETLIDPAHLQPWIDRWGPSASPLLWSHAVHLILRHHLGLPAPGR
jgi:isomaltose glucohydrolase